MYCYENFTVLSDLDRGRLFLEARRNGLRWAEAALLRTRKQDFSPCPPLKDESAVMPVSDVCLLLRYLKKNALNLLSDHQQDAEYINELFDNEINALPYMENEL